MEGNCRNHKTRVSQWIKVLRGGGRIQPNSLAGKGNKIPAMAQPGAFASDDMS